MTDRDLIEVALRTDKALQKGQPQRFLNNRSIITWNSKVVPNLCKVTPCNP